MAASQRRRLLRLLESKGYELVEENDFGVCTYRLIGCRDVRLLQGTGDFEIRAWTRQVEADTRNRDPDDTNEARRAQAEWDREETERLAREQADFDLNRNRRLGGLSAVLTEAEVEQVSRRAEQILADNRRIDRLMRSKPST